MPTRFPKSYADSDLAQMRRRLEQEYQARLAAEARVRTVMADHKKLSIELAQYRNHFESIVVQRTTENTALKKENRDRRMAERERRSIEDQFREATLMLETMLNAIPDIIGVLDIDRRIIRFNQAGYRFFGRKEDQVAGKRCCELIDPVIACDTCAAGQILKTNKPAQVEKYIPSKRVWMDIRAYPIRDMDGRIFRIVEHWRDITELKKSAASLVESEEKYRLLVENANEAIFVFQADDFRFSNHKAREMAHKLGLAKWRRPLEEYVYPDDRGDDPGFLMRRINGLEAKPPAISFRLMHPNGETIWVEMNTINIKWKGSPGTLNFVKDITQGKALERRLQEAQRMESLGTLAGGIAHDFNNLLMGIQGNASLMYLELDHNPSLVEKLKNIEDCVDSGSRLTKQLLGFARGGKYVVKPVNMNHTLHRSAEMFGRTHKTIRIHENYQPELWTVMADRNQIEQVMVNLFLNAWQAMRGSGDLYLQTTNLVLEDPFVKPSELSPGPYVKIGVTDTGIGMDEATQRRIFEPFFTTQAPGRGTGLGLASVFGIVKNHNGIVTVKSHPGKGSTFDIYLPASNQNPEEEISPIQSVQPGSETILLVDDEAFIIDVARLMLEGLGYTLLVATNGQAAIESFSANRDRIDLIILDMVMPDMNGEEVCDQIRAMRQDIKVIFASGYYVTEQVQPLIRSGSSDFIPKPFNLQQLSTKIRSLLDGP